MPREMTTEQFRTALQGQLQSDNPNPTAVGLFNHLKEHAAKLGRPLNDDDVRQVVSQDPTYGEQIKFSDGAPVATVPPPAAAVSQGPPGPGSSSGKLGSMGPGPAGTRGDGKSVFGIMTTPMTELAFGDGANVGTGIRSAIGERTSGPGRFLRELAGKAGDYLDLIQSPAGIATAGEAPVIAKVLMKYPKIAAALKISAGAPAAMGALDTSPEGLANTTANVVVGGMALKPPAVVNNYVTGAPSAASDAGVLDRVKQGLSSIGTRVAEHLAPMETTTAPPPAAAAAAAEASAIVTAGEADAFGAWRDRNFTKNHGSGMWIDNNGRAIAPEQLAREFHLAGKVDIPSGPVRPPMGQPLPATATIPPTARQALRPKLTGGVPAVIPPVDQIYDTIPKHGVFTQPGSMQGTMPEVPAQGRVAAGDQPTRQGPPYRQGGAPQPSIAAPTAQGALPPGRVAGAIEGGQGGWVADPRANIRISAQTANELATKFKVDPSLLIDASGHSNEELVQTVNALHARKAQLSKLAEGNKAEVSPTMIKELGRIADAIGELVLKRDVHTTQAPPVK